MTHKNQTKSRDPAPAIPRQIEMLRKENLTLRRVLMEQPDYSPLIIQLGEALSGESPECRREALAKFHAWQNGDI